MNKVHNGRQCSNVGDEGARSKKGKGPYISNAAALIEIS
jgi:hypothetical protein